MNVGLEVAALQLLPHSTNVELQQFSRDNTHVLGRRDSKLETKKRPLQRQSPYCSI